jgi:hypothetical protein
MEKRHLRVFLIVLLTLVAAFVPALSASAVKARPQCSDGIDNDGDGLIDLGHDPGCTSPSDNDETDNLPQCSDGRDNDGNGLIDFPADPGCDSANDVLESTHVDTQCNDGFDNDHDGFTDFPNDPGCFSVLDNSEKTH